MQPQPCSGIGQCGTCLSDMCYRFHLYHLGGALLPLPARYLHFYGAKLPLPAGDLHFFGAMLPVPAGDLHFYMRHSFQPYRPPEKADPPADGASPSGPHRSSADGVPHLGGRSASIPDRHDGTSLGGGRGLGSECRRLLLLPSVSLLC